jgi:hypothetical protein
LSREALDQLRTPPNALRTSYRSTLEQWVFHPSSCMDQRPTCYGRLHGFGCGVFPHVLPSAASLLRARDVLSLPATGTLWAAATLWIGLGCGLNARRCGRVHCLIDGVLFPLLAIGGLQRAGSRHFQLERVLGSVLRRPRCQLHVRGGLEEIHLIPHIYWSGFFVIGVASFASEVF